MYLTQMKYAIPSFVHSINLITSLQAGDIAEISRYLTPIIKSATKIYTDIPSNPNALPITRSFLSRLTISPSSAPTDLRTLLSKYSTAPQKPTLNALRATKSPAEISNMRHAGRLSGRALTSAMSRPFLSESILAAYIEHQFRTSGLEGSAYIPVVAGGKRGSVIHYTANNHLLPPDETVLVDAGGSYGGYIADITRTWPGAAGPGR